ncbi:MAG TPA: hypothetical protein PKZ66_00740 [Chitinophagaceae bacterium]|nr:hypothetical protein [Chitinophagaceae bacterium]
MKTKFLRVIGLLAIVMLIAMPVIAQDNFPDPEDDIPIDGGLTLLLAAGAGYGAKKLRDKKRKMEEIVIYNNYSLKGIAAMQYLFYNININLLKQIDFYTDYLSGKLNNITPIIG